MVKFNVPRKNMPPTSVNDVVDILNSEIEELKIANLKLIEENEKFLKENREFKIELNKIDNYYASEIENLNKSIDELEQYKDLVDKLKNENNELKSRALVNPRKVNDEQVNNIKELRRNGLSFRAIAKETGLSTCSITRALNGEYDM